MKAGDIESRLLEYKEEENKEHTLIFADFECFTKEYHKPYCLCYCIEDKPVEYIYGEDCAVIFLNKIKDIKHVIVYFHNLGYDGRRWKQLFASTSTISTSDRNVKTDIKDLEIHSNPAYDFCHKL